jgi:hypothetical protein
MSSPCVRYKPIPETTPEVEVDALCAVYRLVLSRAKTKAAEPAPEPDSRDDAKESNGWFAYSNHSK